ncbi:MAG: thioesterase family protein [Bacteroidales bacterium]
MTTDFPKNLIYSHEYKVTEADLAVVCGSGSLAVLSTPSLVAFMEHSAHASLLPYLEVGHATVGVSMQIEHLKPTLPGMTVLCQAKLVQVDGRKFIFEIEAYDKVSLIGTAHHERFLIDSDIFMQKAEKRGETLTTSIVK